MVCQFCRHEFDDSLTECPYCHKQVDFEPKSLTREERDSFSGTTIDIDESGRQGEYQDRGEYTDRDDLRRGDRSYENGEESPGFKVYRLGGGLLTWIIFALIILGIIFFVLPTFLFVGIIGAVVGAIVIFFSRLFQ